MPTTGIVPTTDTVSTTATAPTSSVVAPSTEVPTTTTVPSTEFFPTTLPTPSREVPAPTLEPTGLGDDPTLDALAQSCYDGDLAACDTLYQESETGTPYRNYGDTCAGRQETNSGTWCADAFGSEPPSTETNPVPSTTDTTIAILTEPLPPTTNTTFPIDPTTVSTVVLTTIPLSDDPGVIPPPTLEPTGLGADPALDALAQSCYDGEMAACDVGTRLKAWKTKPTWSRLRIVRARSSRRLRSASPMKALPDVQLVQPGQAVHERRLPRPGRTHDGAELALGELDVDAVEGAHLGRGPAVDLDEAFSPCRRDGAGGRGRRVHRPGRHSHPSPNDRASRCRAHARPPLGPRNRGLPSQGEWRVGRVVSVR